MSQILFLSSDPVLKGKNLKVFEQNGLEAEEAAGCLEGMILLDKNGFGIVVIDDELNDVSGYEACVKVRQQSDVSIILLGTVNEAEVWSKVDELGFDLYLKKPVSPRELLARIRALMRRPVVEKKFGLSSDKSVGRIAPAGNGTLVSRVDAGGLAAQQAKTPDVSAHPAIPQQNVNIPPIYSQPVQSEAIPQPVFSPPSAPKQPPPVQSEVIPQQVFSQPSAPVQSPPVQQATVQPPPIQSQPAQYPEPQNAKPVYLPEDSGPGVLDNARIIKLVDALVSGKLTEITPVIDFNYKLGFAYPTADSLLDTADQETLDILDSLAASGILIKEPYEKFYIDPENMFQLVPTERCPHCDSDEVIRGQLIEHFACGYVGLDKDFKQDSRYVCPKCHKDLRLIGTDYRNVGMHYRCKECSEVFTAPLVKWRNLKTRKIWNAEELREVEVSNYRFSSDKRGWLEFQLKPKKQLVDFLSSRGYQVQELAQMKGRSGAIHTIDVMAVRDDILTKINVGIGLLVANTGEPEVGLEALFKYDTRAYDIGIDYKVVIAIPRLSAEAMNFANRQMIRAFEARNLAAVVSNISNLPVSPVNKQMITEQIANLDVRGSTRVMLMKFMRNRGYDVYEQGQMVGKSGVEHVFDIFARRDDRIIVPTVAICISMSVSNLPIELDEVSRFDAAAFDCGIRNRAFIAIPGISQQAKKFALQRHIDIFEQQDLGRFV